MARYVTLATASYWPRCAYTDVDGRLEEARVFAVRAARMGADIIAYPEAYPILGAPSERWGELAEEATGRTTSFMAEVARANRMYVVWPLYRRQGGRVYNSSVLLDRDGGIVGIYDKMFPTIGEIEVCGCTPGAEAKAYETDFGRVGLAICFDLNFRPVMEDLRRNGAEVVFFSSMYRGGLALRWWAHDLRAYVASAISAELGQIVDMSGTVLAEATYEGLITARVNLDRRMLHMDHNWDKMDAMLEKYGTGLTFQYYTREGKYTIASEMADKTVDEVIAEFELESQPDYFARATRIRNETLART